MLASFAFSLAFGVGFWGVISTPVFDIKLTVLDLVTLLRTQVFHKDATVFRQLSQDFSLAALNTWSPGLGATYKGPRQAESRIDFI